MDTHAAMQTFAKVVELGSFAAAADKLDQARSAVTRQVAFLEQKYGVRLLNRTTRKLGLTVSGPSWPRSTSWNRRCKPRSAVPAAACASARRFHSASCIWARPSPNTSAAIPTSSSTWT
jgi:hypothetical protein